MISIKIVSQTNSVEIGSNEYPKNSVEIVRDSYGNVGLRRVFDGSWIVEPRAPQLYTNNSNVPFADESALVTALRTALYK